MKAGASLCLALMLLALASWPGQGRAAPFDLAGPKLEVRVTRAGRTLPISAVPNLAAGDQIAIKADLPSGQSAHYLLVAAFLRGATDPPPESWFSRTATWTAKSREGLRVTVPDGAQQALVFLAPETGGDFKTLVGAVRGRPGAFVRASQELGQASLDRARLDAFTAAIARINQADPNQLKTASPLLARSLGVKLEASCLQKVSEIQASCLTQDRDALVLDDARSASRLEALASGYSAELVRELSSATWAGAGNYSPYVASLLDIVHLLDASRTAQYQYIPALVTEADERMSLLLNAPPSFQNPKSVLVVALPPVQAPQLPVLHPLEPDAVYCASRPDQVLPIDGAPLVYATGYAHDLVVRLSGKSGKLVDLPARLDAERGGLVVSPAAASAELPTGIVDGVLTGAWGFAPYRGPTFHFVDGRSGGWSAKGSDRPGLVAGQDSTVRLEGPAAVCVESVRLRPASGAEVPLDWSVSAPDEIAIHVPALAAAGGQARLLIKTFDRKDADLVPLGRYGPPSEVASFDFHAGDRSALVTGARLDEVKSATLAGAAFTPVASAAAAENQLELTADDADAVGRLQAGDRVTGQLQLKDGRSVAFQTTVGAARPHVSLMSKDVQSDGAPQGLPIRLGGKDDVPRDAKLTFSIQAQAPTVFTGRETLEIATANGAFSTSLTAADGLTLQDPQVAVATLDIAKRFGASAFGALRFRIVKEGVPTEWQPLVTLVRLPEIRGIACPGGPELPCRLRGSNLFLIGALARDARFDRPTQVPDGFPGDSLPAPRPSGGRLYLKLRDDPASIDTLMISSGPEKARAHVEPSAAPNPSPTPSPTPTSAPAAASPAKPPPAG